MSLYERNPSTGAETKVAGSLNIKDFIGTEQDWNSLTAAEKAQYDQSNGSILHITDDELQDDIIGTTDISDIADGTLTGAVSELNEAIEGDRKSVV